MSSKRINTVSILQCNIHTVDGELWRHQVSTGMQLVLINTILVSSKQTKVNIFVQDSTCRYNNETRGASITSSTDVTYGNETKLQQAVAKVGPISVCIDAGGDGFMDYKSGEPKMQTILVQLRTNVDFPLFFKILQPKFQENNHEYLG